MTHLLPWRRRNGGFLEPFRHEMEDLFEKLFEPVEVQHGNHGQPWMPRLDIEETDKEVIIKADLPGIDAKDVEVSLSDGILTLSGEKKEENEEKSKNYHRVERFVGKYYRAIPLPAGTDPERISAISAKGVLTITVPKKPEAKSRKIEVKSTEK